MLAGYRHLDAFMVNERGLIASHAGYAGFSGTPAIENLATSITFPRTYVFSSFQALENVFPISSAGTGPMRKGLVGEIPPVFQARLSDSLGIVL